MNDQGENIVFLARELLDAGIPEQNSQKKSICVTMTLKTLCFTTFLAAAGGSLMTTVVREQHRPLNRYERVELQALLFYASRLKGINEEILRMDVEKQVGVTHFDDLTADELPVARRYLQEKVQQGQNSR
ncbi:MAG: hypothetical protein P4M13_01675 [Alphaproteobacteria bacterium]|nr:hypothetical protein [Alphaproteobacteria bacterium]